MVRSAVIIFRLLFVLLLAYSGASKLFEPTVFANSLRAYSFLSESWLHFFVFYIPILEIIISISLLIPFTYQASVLSALLLISIFQVALVSLLIRGVDADCGCLGSLGSSPGVALVRNFVLLLALFFMAVALHRKEPKTLSA